MKLRTAIIFAVLPLFVGAQEESNGWLKKLKDYKIEPSLGIQLWGSYTKGEELYNEELGKYDPIDNRLNFQIRRTRIGLKGQPYENLKFNLTAALDFVGRDVLAGTEGGTNNGGSPSFRLWNAYVQWRMKSNSEALNLVAGYLPVQIGRESITSALRSTSMEKAWSQNYLRRHLTGIGPGRAAGVNLGGLLLPEKGHIGLGYDIGVFNPVFEGFSGNSTGRHYAPLFAGRLALYLGDPEFTKYGIGHKVNYFGKRQGLTVAIAGATQGETDLFLQNQALGMDVLFNWGKLNVDGDWTMLYRSGRRLTEDQVHEFTASANTGYIRASYNVNLPNQYVLEPVVMLVQFNGALDAIEQSDAAAVGALYGKDQSVDVGFNLYPNPDLKLSLHYTFRKGNAGDVGDGAKINNYFYQSGAGAIHRGEWLGLGLIAIL